jgi:hypothetical protein
VIKRAKAHRRNIQLFVGIAGTREETRGKGRRKSIGKGKGMGTLVEKEEQERR